MWLSILPDCSSKQRWFFRVNRLHINTLACHEYFECLSTKMCYKQAFISKLWFPKARTNFYSEFLSLSRQKQHQIKVIVHVAAMKQKVHGRSTGTSFRKLQHPEEASCNHKSYEVMWGYSPSRNSIRRPPDSPWQVLLTLLTAVWICWMKHHKKFLLEKTVWGKPVIIPACNCKETGFFS